MTAFLNNFETGLPKEAVKLATAFGGGMGHTKNTCGAITGAVMALSAIVGRENPMGKETWQAMVQVFSSLTQLCPTLCDPMDYSMPGLPVQHQLPELNQTHVH